MNPGTSYDVLFGGLPAGKVILQKNDNPGYSLTPVEFTGTNQPHGHVQALATSIVTFTDRHRTRQASTEDEKGLAMRLARTLYEDAGISISLLGKMKVENLTKTIVARATSPTIIGSFSLPAADVESSGAYENLFFIASAKAGELVPELVWTNLAQGEAGLQSQQFVDQVDLLSDGQDEIVSEIYYYKNWSYVIYRRATDSTHCDKLLETHVRGCL